MVVENLQTINTGPFTAISELFLIAIIENQSVEMGSKFIVQIINLRGLTSFLKL